MSNPPGERGFTIVELLIVVVVIAVLAAITIVAYNGITIRANDTVRRDAASRLAQAYKAWIAETGKTPAQLGCGWGDSGVGWVQFTDSEYYAGASCVDLLAEAGYLPRDFTSRVPAPRTSAPYNTPDRAFMLAWCSASPKQLALVWYVQNPSSADRDAAASIMSTCGASTFPYSQYGMTTGELLSW